MQNITDLIETVLNEVSGKQAWDWVAKISQYNRMRGSRDYHEIVERIIKELKEYGLDEVIIHKYPADGKSKSWEWVAPLGWEVSFGELTLLDPVQENICRFRETPMCVVGYSKSCDVTAELVDVGKGSREEDFAGKDVKGKIILMEAPELFIPPLYVKKGAIGLILYPSPEKVTGFRDLTNYNRFPVKLDILKETTFGFSISHEKALYMKHLLEKGLVKVHAKIDAQVLEDKQMEIISAAIRGSEKPEEEVILSAHLCHAAAGANDNASGSAGLIELARSLKNLIDNKALPRPLRTIRFLWIPEFDGSWPWAKEHVDKVKNALCNINLDMIGEHPLKIGQPFNLCLSPYSRPSIFNDMLKYFTKVIANHPKGIAINGTKVPMRYRILPFSGGSDQQVFIDSAIGIPGTMFGHEDPLWHTSLDTLEYCDSTELHRVISIAFCTAYTFSTLKGDFLLKLWSILENEFYQRLGIAKEIILQLHDQMLNTNEMSDSSKSSLMLGELALLGRTIIANALDYEKRILESTNKFGPKSTVMSELISLNEGDLEQWNDRQQVQWDWLCKQAGIDLASLKEPEYFSTIYELGFKGLKNLEDLFPIAMSPQFSKIQVPEPPKLWFGDLHEMLNLIGCSYKLKDICAILTLEYQHFFYPSEVQKFLKFLKRKQLVWDKK